MVVPNRVFRHNSSSWSVHVITSFICAVGTLVDGSGLTELMSSAFAGVAKIMTGKKFPENFRALRLIVEELL